MKKIFLKIAVLFILILFNFNLSSQNYHIIESNSQKVILKVTTGKISIGESLLAGNSYSNLKMENYLSGNHIGEPQLPVMTELLEIPICEDISYQARAGRVDTFSTEELGILYPIYPAQPSVPKSQTTPTEPIINTQIYQTDEFYGYDIVKVEKIGIMRNANLATLYVSPVQYNPITKQIMIYDDITIEITYEHPDIEATREMKRIHGNPFFNVSSKVINPIHFAERDEISTVPIKYEIIAHSMFRGELDNFIDWKKRKGFLVEVAYTDSIGTTESAIRNYIHSLYTNATEENPAPTYVLLVGDVAQIPNQTKSAGWFSSHVTDLYYFTWTAGDNLPDCYYGRFSAQNVSQLGPQIEKTLMYEQYTMRDPRYLDDAVIVAGEDQGNNNDHGYSHANPTMHYLEDNYLTSEYGFRDVHSFYNPHASTDEETIRSLIGNGVGYANYSAHCSYQGWADPAFENNHISSMNNNGKYGLMIGNCCESNQFNQSECFGEKLLRTPLKGAVGYIGASNSTYWDEDFYWAVGARPSIQSSCSNCNNFTYDANNLGAYDRLFHTHGEDFSHWFVSQGSIITAGNLAVEASTSDSKTYYWEIYHLMGDPSVMPWLTQASAMDLHINNTLITNNEYGTTEGTTTLSIYTGAPYAYVALTHHLELITAAVADQTGYVVLTFPALENHETYELAATAQNHIPNFTTISTYSVGLEALTTSTVSIFPNPIKDHFMVKLSQGTATDIMIFDIAGKLLKQVAVTGNTMDINMEEEASGMYFVKIFNHQENIGTYKIVKK